MYIRAVRRDLVGSSHQVVVLRWALPLRDQVHREKNYVVMLNKTVKVIDFLEI